MQRFDQRVEKRTRLTELGLLSKAFRDRRDRLRGSSSENGDAITETDIKEEQHRRIEMSKLRSELYGLVPEAGTFDSDPEWDDVVPIPVEEPEGALASISYPQEYAQGTSPLSP